MDRRTYTALALCMLFFLVFRVLFPGPSATVAETVDQVGTQPATSARPAAPATEQRFESDVVRADDLVVETDLFSALFTNHGAVLEELYSRTFFRKPGLSAEERRDPANYLPLILAMEDEALTACWKVHAGAGAVDPLLHARNWNVAGPTRDADQVQLEFTLKGGDGFEYCKRFRFRDGSYLIELDLAVRNLEVPSQRRGTLSTTLVAAANLRGDHATKIALPTSAVVGHGDAPELEVFSASKLFKGDVDVATNSERRRARLFGTQTNYFATVMRPLDAVTAESVISVSCSGVFDRPAYDEEIALWKLQDGGAVPAKKLESLREKHEDNARSSALLRLVVPEQGGETLLHMVLYAGPKSSLTMQDEEYAEYRPLYEEDYGRLAFINKTLLWILRRFHRLVGNWGVAIILLTILVKVVLFPLNRAQSRTMESFQKKMAKLKPELDAIREKYKNNLQKYSQEQRRLMQEHGVRTPMLGCLLIFAQLPVFYGLFQIFRSSFDLRHQPFLSWINDLSQPDACPLPFALLGFDSINILPILMVAAMTLNTKMMPKPADPQAAQMQKMMVVMNLFFGIFLYGYAAGLSLYMLTNALLGIAQFKLLRTTSAA